MKWLMILVSLFALTACGSGKEAAKACTDIAARQGVGITLTPEIATGATEAKLKVCKSGVCTEDPLELLPGTKTIDEGCNQDEVDGVCSARNEPDGSLVGFHETELDGEDIDVTLSFTRSGKTESFEANTRPTQVFPNGEECGGAAYQANLELAGNGLLRPADAASGNS